MSTGLEGTDVEVIVQLIGNLKTGIVRLMAMGDEKYIAKSHKECPPIAAFEVNMSLLECFKAEAYKLGINPDEIGPDISQYEDYWLKITS